MYSKFNIPHSKQFFPCFLLVGFYSLFSYWSTFTFSGMNIVANPPTTPILATSWRWLGCLLCKFMTWRSNLHLHVASLLRMVELTINSSSIYGPSINYKKQLYSAIAQEFLEILYLLRLVNKIIIKMMKEII